MPAKIPKINVHLQPQVKSDLEFKQQPPRKKRFGERREECERDDDTPLTNAKNAREGEMEAHE
ncbi:MAG: hypothetical protein HC769_04680 [Cyanobacteria bacterium CRU_2_1]|nr:hypothetical protein [Cyanobacteria bacterium RU_5_0]NJR58207.1 hypothetical protein [Cyanobacteria bacterium CRU_2_1]